LLEAEHDPAAFTVSVNAAEVEAACALSPR
jgi:hypothetical protein